MLKTGTSLVFDRSRRMRFEALALLLCWSISGLQSQTPRTRSDVAQYVQLGSKAEEEGRLSEALADFRVALQMDPRNPQVNFKIGLLMGQSGNFAAAGMAFQKALESRPDFPEAHFNLGLTWIARSKNLPDWPKALREFDAALAQRPKYPEALNMAGVCLLESGNHEAAIERFKSALLLRPDAAAIHFNLGRAYEAAGNLPQAKEEYLKAVKLKSPYPEADVALGSLMLAKHDYSGAIAQFRAALIANPDLETAHYKMARALRMSGSEEESRVEFQQAAYLSQRLSDGIRASHLSNEALERAQHGDFPGAVQSAREAVALDPQNAIALYNLGLLLADSGDLNQAMLDLRKAISLSPLQSRFYASLARMQEKSDQPSRAIESLRRALRLDPGNSVLQSQLAALKGPGSSPSEVEAEEKENPFAYGAPSDTPDGHLAFATQLSKEGDLRGAIGELLRGLALQPGRNDIRYSLAVAYMGLGEYKRAEYELRKILLKSPESIETRLALGTALLQEHEQAYAAAEFRKVLASQPTNSDAIQLLSQCHEGHQ